MPKKPFGIHLIIDADDCEGNITDKKEIQNFINDLCQIGGMEKKGDTIFEYFEDNEYNRERDIVGYSVVQIISLSNITIHINEISKTMYFDFFTCGVFCDFKVNLLFSDYFKPKKMKKQIIYRDAKSIN
jgi:S-adenosylmethionine/arginine decarboxylase-like enzyme